MYTVARKRVWKGMEPECFVCLRPGNLVSGGCECKTLYVHRKCLQKSIRASMERDRESALQCTVCKTPYTNVTLKRFRVCAGNAMVFFVGHAGALLAIGGMFAEIYYYAEEGDVKLLIAAAGFAVCAILLLSIVAGFLRWRQKDTLYNTLFEKRARIVVFRPTTMV